MRSDLWWRTPSQALNEFDGLNTPASGLLWSCWCLCGSRSHGNANTDQRSRFLSPWWLLLVCILPLAPLDWGEYNHIYILYTYLYKHTHTHTHIYIYIYGYAFALSVNRHSIKGLGSVFFVAWNLSVKAFTMLGIYIWNTFSRNILSSTGFNIDNNQNCFLSTKSVY